MGGECEVWKILPRKIREGAKSWGTLWCEVEEIRFRVGQPVWMLSRKGAAFVDTRGAVTLCSAEGYRCLERDILEILEYASQYSLYAFQEQIRQGFITIRGGHRIGVAGRVLVKDGKVVTVAEIGAINIRVAREEKEGAGRIYERLKNENGFLSTLILSPPGGGKTTMLRKLIRLLASEEEAYTVGIVDERSEIAACYHGVPQYDLGVTVDVLDACPKAEGMSMLLRSMAPDVIVVDEIGCDEEMEVIKKMSSCGCRLLATMHGEDLGEIVKKKGVRELIEEEVFKRFVVMGNRYSVGSVKGIFDKTGKKVCGYHVDTVDGLCSGYTRM